MPAIGTKLPRTVSGVWFDQKPDLPDPEVVFGRSAGMEALRINLLKAAQSDIPVLITGESGTGKQVIAQMLHMYSPRAAKPFVQRAKASARLAATPR